MATAAPAHTPSAEYAALYGALNEQLQRMLACRGPTPGSYIDPVGYAKEEETLCDMLLPVLRRMARGNEVVGDGALRELFSRWHRNQVTHLTPFLLNICLADAARRENQGAMALLPFDGPEQADRTQNVPSSLARQKEQADARQSVGRLCQELHRFGRQALNDDDRLRTLFLAMLQAEDLAWGFQSRHAEEVGVRPGTITRWMENLQRRFDQYMNGVADLPVSTRPLREIILELRGLFPDGVPGEDTNP